jgi:hypothetical protein
VDYLGQELAACRNAFCSVAAESRKKSRLQEDVAQVLTDMGIGFHEEYVDERSGYSLDMVILDKVKRGPGVIAIEVCAQVCVCVCVRMCVVCVYYSCV